MAETPTGDVEISRYPLSLIAQSTDWFKITAFDYNASGGAGTNAGITSLTSSGLGQIVGHIILPMPSNIQDGNSVSYGEDKLNTITAAALSGIEGAMSIDLGNLPTSLADAGNKIKSAVESTGLGYEKAGELIRKTLAAEAVSIFGGNVSVESLIARESGQIFNPNMELLFNGVTLRTFRFSFKMTPREPKESTNIKRIIRFLKQKMAARGSGTFLDTPHIFDLSYRKGGAKHPFLHTFKPCFLKDMSVNYTGENVYSTYSDGTPISIVMDLTFQEIVPVYESDYDLISIDTEGVGY